MGGRLSKKYRKFNCYVCGDIIETKDSRIKYCYTCRRKKAYHVTKNATYRELKVKRMKLKYCSDLKTFKSLVSGTNGYGFRLKAKAFSWGNKLNPPQELKEKTLHDLYKYVEDLKEDIITIQANFFKDDTHKTIQE